MVPRSGVTMVPEIDIWRAANLLIRKHGANAELEAAKRADVMLDRGDDDGRPGLARAVCLLTLREPKGGYGR